MTPADVKKHFKTGYNFRAKTGMSDNNLRNWIKCGYVPYKSQRKIELLTEGILTAVWDEKEPYFSPVKEIKD
jgi:hypothetical protein